MWFGTLQELACSLLNVLAIFQELIDTVNVAPDDCTPPGVLKAAVLARVNIAVKCSWVMPADTHGTTTGLLTAISVCGRPFLGSTFISSRARSTSPAAVCVCVCNWTSLRR